MTVPNDSPPMRPLEPNPADCCGEGCPHCILDVYDAALERYEAELAAWRARQEHSGRVGLNACCECSGVFQLPPA